MISCPPPPTARRWARWGQSGQASLVTSAALDTRAPGSLAWRAAEQALCSDSSRSRKSPGQSQKPQVPGLSLPLPGDVTSGHLGSRLLSCKVGIVTLAVPVLQGGWGSQMRSWAWKCPANSKVWSNYEGLRLLLLSTHSNCSGSCGNKHIPGPRSRC